MAANATPATTGRQQVGLSEWFSLRRYPFPMFSPSLEGLPASLASLAGSALPPGSAVQGVLSLPPEYYARHMLAWEYVPERALIFLDAAALHVRAEGPKTSAETLLIDGRSLLYVRSSLLLLYGLLEMKADCGSQPGEVRVEYNTVIWNALREPLGRFLTASAPFAPEDEAAVRAENRAAVKPLPFKFANGLLYYALEPGERLHAAIFQPAIWKGRGLLSVQVTPNTLFALTNGKAVLIEEKRASVWGRRTPQGEYGWIFTYIPRDRVVDLAITPRERWAELKLHLQLGSVQETRAFLLEPAIAAQWERAWQKYVEQVDG